MGRVKKITIENAEPFRVCNSCYKGDRVYNIIIRYASTNSGTQISLCCDCLKKLNDAIGETLWKEDGARITETHEKREETHACDSISRQAAVIAVRDTLKRIPPSAIRAMTAIRELPPAQHWIPCSERLPDEDYWTGANFQNSTYVLMTVYNAEDKETIIDYGHTVDGSWYSDTTDCFVPSWWEVVAWMPLPTPYREGGGDTNEPDKQTD